MQFYTKVTGPHCGIKKVDYPESGINYRCLGRKIQIFSKRNLLQNVHKKVSQKFLPL